MRFEDRRHAGRILGQAVSEVAPESPIVLALPRGGVPVGFEVAEALGSELDLLLVRKVGVPGHEELAMGAVAEGGVTVVHEPVVAAAGVDDESFEYQVSRAREALDSVAAKYRSRPMRDITGLTAVIVDDGLATGSTARAAVEVARARDAGEVWLAVPVAPPETVGEMAPLVDRMIVSLQPARFMAVGAWYRNFTQVDDAEVRRLLSEAG